MSTAYYSVQKWSVSTYNTGTSLWNAATSWPRGSINAFSEVYTSNIQVLDLADGTKGLFTPTRQWNLDNITLTWQRRTVTDTFITNLKSYIKDKMGLKITLHDTSATVLEGYLIKMEKSWDFTGATQFWTLQVEMVLFDVDGDGSAGNL